MASKNFITEIGLAKEKLTWFPMVKLEDGLAEAMGKKGIEKGQRAFFGH